MALIDGLVSHWRMEEASGTRIDSHGTNDLTDAGTTPLGQAAGKQGNAADWETTSGNQMFLSHVDNADLSVGDIDFTFAMWLQLDSKPGIHIILAKDEGADREYEFYYYNVDDRFHWAVWTPAGAITDLIATTFGSPSTGVWYYVEFGHDSINNQIWISVNGGTRDTAAHTGGVKNAAATFTVGAIPGPTFILDGLIDELSFWKSKKTEAEIDELVNGGAGLAWPWPTGGGPVRQMYDYRRRRAG